MSRSDVLGDVVKGGCVATQSADKEAPENASYMLTTKSTIPVVVGVLRFASDRLTVVSRNWDVEVHDEVSFAEALISLLKGFEAESNTSCRIKSYEQSNPGLNSKGAMLICGSKQIVIGEMVENGSKSISISETLYAQKS